MKTLYYYTYQLLATVNSTAWYIKLLATALLWIAPAQEAFLLLMFLVVVDTITGIWKAISKGEPYTSKGLVPTLKKLGLYALLTIVFHSLQVHFLKDTLKVFNILMSIPIFREVTSVAENIEALTGLKIVTKLNELLSSVAGKLGDKASGKDDKDEDKK